MDNLPQSVKNGIVFMEQKFMAHHLSWTADHRRDVLSRILNFYERAGVDRLQGRQLEKAATAATNGWAMQTLPPEHEAFVNKNIFGECPTCHRF